MTKQKKSQLVRKTKYKKNSKEKGPLLSSKKTQLVPQVQIDKDIKNIYFANTSKELDIKISKVKETSIKVNGRSKTVNHVIVKTKKKTGPTSSFEALVDPKSNVVYKTWNQTRFETNKTFKIKAAGLEFYSK